MIDRLPNASRALIEEQKLGEYLLNPAHPDNSGKAAFFLRLGFARSSPELLGSALLSLAEEGIITRRVSSVHGTKFVVDGVPPVAAGPLRGPLHFLRSKLPEPVMNMSPGVGPAGRRDLRRSATGTTMWAGSP